MEAPTNTAMPEMRPAPSSARTSTSVPCAARFASVSEAPRSVGSPSTTPATAAVQSSPAAVSS
ncbi:MAG: hypothetical protein QM704_25165 [Anaeromyxobacteraceae bacterium]